jgi:hypothetical protein
VSCYTNLWNCIRYDPSQGDGDLRTLGQYLKDHASEMQESCKNDFKCLPNLRSCHSDVHSPRFQEYNQFAKNEREILSL